MASDSGDPLDKLAAAIKSRKAPKKVSKANRTHALAEPSYSILQRYCRSKGVHVSELLDGLIAAFLEKVKDDLPAPEESENESESA
jgi:hypothetical protein